jgi:hypothetical protein
MSNPRTQKALLMFSNTLMAKKGGEIVVLAVKDVTEKKDFYEALSDAHDTLEVIQKSVELGKKNNIRFKPVIRASRNIARGIVHVAEEEKCDLILIGFPEKPVDYKSTVFNNVLKLTKNDLLILNLKADPDTFSPETIGVYIKGRRNINLMLTCATAVAEKRKARIVLIGFLPKEYSKKQKTKVDKLMIESLQNMKSTALYDIKLNVSDNPVEELIKMSSGLDVLIVGKDTRKGDQAVEELPSFQISRQAACTVLMVKTVKKIDRIVNKI